MDPRSPPGDRGRKGSGPAAFPERTSHLGHRGSVVGASVSTAGRERLGEGGMRCSFAQQDVNGSSEDRGVPHGPRKFH